MPILNIVPVQIGAVGVIPSIACIATNDTLAQVTVTGYLNQAIQNGASLNESSMCLVSTKTSPSAAAVQVGWLEVSHVGANWSLVPTGAPGTVVLPTIANHIATYTNTTGTLSEDASTAINAGNIQAGLSGNAGYFASFPSAASKGSFRFTAVANTNDTLTTLSNVAMGQASVVSIPDPANAVGRLLIGATATPFVNGNFPMNSGTGGLMVDSGVAVSSLATTANVVLLTPAGNQTITVGALIVSAGALQSGLSAGGFVGSLIAYPTTATSGNIQLLAAVNGSGNFGTAISNATTQAQSQVVTIPSAGAATGQFLIGAGATPFVSGNFPVASGTGGLMVDSGVAATNLQNKTNIIAATTANIGGAGAGPISVVVAGLTAASVVVATIETSSNTVAVGKCNATATGFDVTFTGDPGATCTLNYVAFANPQ